MSKKTVSKAPSKAPEILDLARQMIATGGYNGFSYSDIAREIGVSAASIHYHFPAKADLVKAVVTQYREDSQMHLAAASQQHDDPLVLLRMFAGFWEKCLREGPLPFCICVMLASEAPMIPKEVIEVVNGHFDDLSGWLAVVLADAQKRGLVRLNADAAIEARMLMTVVHGSMIAARAAGSADWYSAVVWPALDRLLVGATAPAPAASAAPVA